MTDDRDEEDEDPDGTCVDPYGGRGYPYFKDNHVIGEDAEESDGFQYVVENDSDK
ncbi:uncharacterized protein Nmag_4011 (plasmid) [Natrialba magadii ATCC 43099]|uniref:Uncharacterized protein n=1 Tax=Natrialba magadii (strain ATCC 43099 / DSM 3394 / CCM 3739 / CIP 104546 / IAM 13178 / JCM 8861 / NBRC 102185 / NCIMB 2190 / MS3) TaxID=547559 RepID=D3T1T4_NATMM|nr:hypothetical protein [Natrialba magadii]ADD07543.1 uncharacterized protein Nmag_4011 [Natrialba magadii ATCC 43099]ELY26579.1 hypothetical protein C500_15490 [Natrialba magadii ATCC 43099]